MAQDDPSFLPVSRAMVLTKTALKNQEAQNAQAQALADANTKLDNVDGRLEQHEAKFYNLQAQLENVLDNLSELNRRLDTGGMASISSNGGTGVGPGASKLEGSSAGSTADSMAQLKAQVKQLRHCQRKGHHFGGS